jgi:hypothetical protein
VQIGGEKRRKSLSRGCRQRSHAQQARRRGARQEERRKEETPAMSVAPVRGRGGGVTIITTKREEAQQNLRECFAPGEERSSPHITNLGATVRSSSSFALFRSNACCLQSSNLAHECCSGSRCWRKGERERDGQPLEEQRAKTPTSPQNSFPHAAHMPTIRMIPWVHGFPSALMKGQRFLTAMVSLGGVGLDEK